VTDANDPRNELIEHLPAMRAFARSLTRDPAAADDLVQDAVVKAWSNFDKFQQGSNMRAWLFTILRNTYYSLCRKRRREVEDPDGVMAGQLSEKPSHDGSLAMADFRVAFAQLSDEHREVLILVGAEGFSCEDVAEMCGCAVGTIKSRTNRARKRLKELMHLDEDENFELTDPGTMAIVYGKPAA
jgi:RNA polymerase sigma-70 factor, ECF subfamily